MLLTLSFYLGKLSLHLTRSKKGFMSPSSASPITEWQNEGLLQIINFYILTKKRNQNFLFTFRIILEKMSMTFKWKLYFSNLSSTIVYHRPTNPVQGLITELVLKESRINFTVQTGKKQNKTRFHRLPQSIHFSINNNNA